MKIKQLLLPVIALCMTAVSSHAATIIYNFSAGDALVDLTNNAPDSATSAATSNDFGSGITASVWTATSPTGEIGVSGGRMVAVKKADTDTHTFTVTIPSGVYVDFTALSFSYGNVGGDTSPANFTVTSTVAGGTFAPQNVWTHTAGTFDGTASMTLGGNFLSDITNTTVTFTFADSAGGNNNSLALHTFIDNVTLTGTVVPEPSTALLGGLGILCLLRRRR